MRSSRASSGNRYGLIGALVFGAIALAAIVSRQRLKLTAERRVLQATRAAKELAERADAFKTRLVSIVSHDLKAPVAALIGGAELLQRDADDTAAVKSMASLMESESLRCVIAPELEDVRVSGDSGRLQQVIENLLDNALKFTPAGKAVRIEVSGGAGSVRVSVQDAGPGLTEEDYARVFQPLQKLSARPTGGESSTGPGLSIVRELIALHGGQMIVKSVPGQGAPLVSSCPSWRDRGRRPWNNSGQPSIFLH